MTTRTILVSLFFFCASAVQISNVQAADAPCKTLKACLTELQKNPGDRELREKIIKLALKLKNPPAVPEKAERWLARGRAAVKTAEDKEGYLKAVAEFEKAALAAPWLADVYYNLGLVQDKAQDYAGAMQSFQLYLLAAPKAEDAKEVKSLIYEIEYKQEQAEHKASPQGQAAKPRGFEGQWDHKRSGKLMPYMTVTIGDDGKFRIQSDMPDRTIEDVKLYDNLTFDEITSRYDPPKFKTMKFPHGDITFEIKNGWSRSCKLELEGAFLVCIGGAIKGGKLYGSGENWLEENLYRREE